MVHWEQKLVTCISDSVTASLGQRIDESFRKNLVRKEPGRSIERLARRLVATHPGAPGLEKILPNLPPE